MLVLSVLKWVGVVFEVYSSFWFSFPFSAYLGFCSLCVKSYEHCDCNCHMKHSLLPSVVGSMAYSNKKQRLKDDASFRRFVPLVSITFLGVFLLIFLLRINSSSNFLIPSSDEFDEVLPRSTY